MNKNQKRMDSCPRYKFCNAPMCPLDELRDQRVYVKGEDKCGLSKTKRKKLGKDLPWRGLTPKEQAGENAWKNRSEESRFATIQKLKSEGFKKRFGSLNETPDKFSALEVK